MKPKTWTKPAYALLAACALFAPGGGNAIAATAPAAGLNGQLQLRPLTPQEIKDHALTGRQTASGLNTIGIGQPAYLDAVVNSSVAPASITSVTWNLSNKPIGSAAAITSSPLSTNVPVYKPADRLVLRVAGRAVLVPDVVGQYTVVATINTTTGTTNVSQTITAATFLGAQTCALCHSGGVVASNTFTTWQQTPHATAFTRKIDGIGAPTFNKNCVSCHVTGYDAHTNAVNGGFDDIAASVNWQFPTSLTNGNWAAMHNSLKGAANIQCESCHGPGSEHAMKLGNVNYISTSFSAGDCAQCHDSLSKHWKVQEWNSSGHAISPRQTGSGCVRCHTAEGFARYTAGMQPIGTEYEAISCAACHDPHDASKPHQLRNVGPIALMDNKTVISDAGAGMVCMNCHMSRRDATNYVEVTAGSANFGPHHSLQTDMLMGVNAVTYGKDIPSSAHRDSVEGTCVTCHMQPITSGPAFTHAGGHTFRLAWDGGTTNTTADDVEVVGACKQCHGEIESFDLRRQDYDGDGLVEGVQTEVQGMLAKLGMLLPPVGTPKTSINITASWTKQQLRAGYNYKFVQEDGSFGIHNTAYAVGLLKASIADLSGDANNDGLADTWQTAYFGSATHPNAAPNATPSGDGIPNWLKFALGLNPNTSGVVLPDGVVWMNANTLVNSENPGSSNVKIYTAAEVVFDTVAGKNYQIQGVSSLSGGWQNIGSPIPGTGQSVSYVTPTRSNAQMFFRVSSTP
ncbi:MAG TPA: multiheme c-type cytochrome [Verrucomicrobiae bacterium]|nr:multiheme c-type cytochrome [Verrucomicrobiae bacterium]